MEYRKERTNETWHELLLYRKDLLKLIQDKLVDPDARPESLDLYEMHGRYRAEDGSFDSTSELVVSWVTKPKETP